MISGAMAAMGGVIFASRLNSVDLTAGSGTILLDAIAAAVIGGASLFGGRGRVSGALFDGLIIAMIANGIDLVGYQDCGQFIVTGPIMLASRHARHRRAAPGRRRPLADPARERAAAVSRPRTVTDPRSTRPRDAPWVRSATRRRRAADGLARGGGTRRPAFATQRTWLRSRGSSAMRAVAKERPARTREGVAVSGSAQRTFRPRPAGGETEEVREAERVVGRAAVARRRGWRWRRRRGGGAKGGEGGEAAQGGGAGGEGAARRWGEEGRGGAEEAVAGAEEEEEAR